MLTLTPMFEICPGFPPCNQVPEEETNHWYQNDEEYTEKAKSASLDHTESGTVEFGTKPEPDVTDVGALVRANRVWSVTVDENRCVMLIDGT